MFDFGTTENPLMRLHHNEGTTGRFATGYFDLVDDEDFWVVGAWAFVVATVDADGTKNLYKDGVLEATAAGPTLDTHVWGDDTNYRIAGSNWSNEEDETANLTVMDLRFFDVVISDDCRAELMATATQ